MLCSKFYLCAALYYHITLFIEINCLVLADKYCDLHVACYTGLSGWIVVRLISLFSFRGAWLGMPEL